MTDQTWRPELPDRRKEPFPRDRVRRTIRQWLKVVLASGLGAAFVLVVASGPAASPLEPQVVDETLEEKEASVRHTDTRFGEPAPEGTRRALVICGHPGDEAHRKMYAQTVEKLHEGLTGRSGFSPKEVWIRFGSKPQEEDGPALSGARGLSTRKEIEGDVAELRKVLKPEDTLWVIVLGHAHFDGRHSFLNLPGPDIREDQFGKLFEGIQSREEVFLITTPASGFFIKHLSARGRIVITATEADWEVNETLFHRPLAAVLSNPPEKDEYDQDRDGRITVFDLYLAVARVVMLTYKAEDNIPTEHALLDDNGDGRGTEVQLDYLEPELGGRARLGSRPGLQPSADSVPTADGALAATVEIRIDPVPEIEPTANEVPVPDPGPEPPSTPAGQVDQAKEPS